MSATFTTLALAFALNVYAVSAQHVHDSSDSSTSTTEGSIMMVPYLHFTPGDALWFKDWVPKSRGAIVGTCIGLFLLAIVERFLAALKGVMESWWRRKTDAMLARRLSSVTATEDGTSQDGIEKDQTQSRSTAIISIPYGRRNLPPFVPSHDLVRGCLQTLQTAAGYALMLAVMTFNVSFIVSLLIGTFVGEVAFGRYSSLGAHS